MTTESAPALLVRLRGRLRSDRFDAILVKRADMERLVAIAESAWRLAEAMIECAHSEYCNRSDDEPCDCGAAEYNAKQDDAFAAYRAAEEGADA